MNYFSKMKGASKSPPRVSLWEIFLSWLGSFLGIGAIALIHLEMNHGLDMAMLVGSFGASAVLVYGATKSPLAQPPNLIGGHVVSALIAVIGSDEIHALGFMYALAPIGIGVVILLIVALIFNNLSSTRHYPEYWL